ncbi:MAG: outer membrane lipoprotein carrier protein LolA [Aquimonas sp.]|nr:outer membrane lipoprotein carrier protein LolA [Aquimonas sp.]
MRIALASLLFAASLPALAMDPESRMEAFGRGLVGLAGAFEQQVLDPNGLVREETRGEVALAVPRQLRWEYIEPFPQLIVADGEHLFIYDPDLEQVTVRRQLHEEQNNPLLALIDPIDRRRQFQVEDGGRSEGLDWIELIARAPEAPIRRALLGFDGLELASMRFVDSLDQRTEISFGRWQRNPDFHPDTFRFQIPDGVDVVGDYDPAAEILPLGE